MTNPSKGLMVVVGLLFTPLAVRADFQFQFDQSAYTVNPGGTVQVNVFLVETNTNLLSTLGVLGAGVRVNVIAPFPSQPAAVLANSDILANPAFDQVGGGTGVGPNTAGLAEFVFFNPTVFPNPGTPDRILIGSFIFTAGGVPGEVTHLQATRFDPVGDFFALGDGSVPGDGSIADGTADIRVSSQAAVPGPSSLALCVIGLATLAVSRLHMRTKQRG